jgi:hypothetical protein
MKFSNGKAMHLVLPKFVKWTAFMRSELDGYHLNGENIQARPGNDPEINVDKEKTKWKSRDMMSRVEAN